MVVGDLYLVSIPVMPAKANPPLVVDPNRMLAGAITVQGMELVSRRGLQIAQLLCRTDDLELDSSPPVDVLWEPAGELTVKYK